MPNVTKGRDLGRLLRYLYGPGRYNEHTNPHLVAGYDDAADLEPPVDEHGARALASLAANLSGPVTAARVLGEPVPRNWVWHCSLSLDNSEGEQGDQRWCAIAVAFAEEMGFAGRRDGDDCRWIAVHHGQSRGGNDHVHLVVPLVTDSGRIVNVHNDYYRAQQAARRLEERFGLRQVAVRDGQTHRLALTRAELDRAERHGDKVADRTWLRHQVRAAVAGAATETEFVAQLRARGVLVHVRTDAADPRRGGHRRELDPAYRGQPRRSDRQQRRRAVPAPR